MFNDNNNDVVRFKGFTFDNTQRKLIIKKWFGLQTVEYSYDDISNYSTAKDYNGMKGIGCLGWIIILALCCVGIGFFILLWALLKRKKQMLGHLAIYIRFQNGHTEVIRFINHPKEINKAQKQLNKFNQISLILDDVTADSKGVN